MRASCASVLALLVISLGLVNALSHRELPPHQPRLSPITLDVTGLSVTTQNYTHFLQCDSAWGSNRLGTSTSNTICSAGCAMTSLSMVLNTWGEKISSQPVNPGLLNSWLTANSGYVGGDLLVWAAADSLGVVKYSNYYRGAGSLSLSSMQQLVSAGHPIIVNVLDGAHWVLVVGFSGSTFAVNDPAAFHTTYDYSGMSNFVVYNV